MPRAGLSRERVVEISRDLADESGLEKLTLAAVASQAGVKLPSLYKHVGGIDDLRRDLAISAKLELGQLLARAAAGKSSDDAVRAIAAALRDWAREFPGRYESTVSAPDPEDAQDVEASAAAVDVMFSALAGYRLDDDAVVDATRMLRATLQGFITIEASGGFGMARSVDDSFETAVAALTLTLSSWPASTRQ